MIEWVPITLHWMWRTRARQTSYRRKIVKPRPAGTLALPGDAAALRQYQDNESGAVMVHDPHAQTLTSLLEVTHPSFILLDPGEQERRVHALGQSALDRVPFHPHRPTAGARAHGPRFRVGVVAVVGGARQRRRLLGRPHLIGSSSTGQAPQVNATSPRSRSAWTCVPPLVQSAPRAAA